MSERERGQTRERERDQAKKRETVNLTRNSSDSALFAIVSSFVLLFNFEAPEGEEVADPEGELVLPVPIEGPCTEELCTSKAGR